MFENFRPFTVPVAGGVVAGRIAGSGPAVLLLHGIPQTHVMWRDVAPALAADYTVVAADLRGYGGSSSSVGTTGGDHRHNAMRSLASDQAHAMQTLGHDRFAVIGHDRGARCAYRLALDHPDRVTALGVLDIVPTADAFAAADREFALDYWVWSFLAAPWPVPERLLAADPDVLVDHMLDTWSGDPSVFDDEVRQAYRAQFQDPDRVHAICEQYRAAARWDVEHDEADLDRTLPCPVLALWSATGAVGAWYDPEAVWRRWANDVTGVALDAGHFLAEEAPEQVLAYLQPFLRRATAAGRSAPA